MKLKINGNIVVNQPIEQVWHILGEEFVNISHWASANAFSQADEAVTPLVADAPVGGRVCTAPGYGDVREVITYFNAQEKWLIS